MIDIYVTALGFVYLRSDGFNIQKLGEIGYFSANYALLNPQCFPVTGHVELLAKSNLNRTASLSPV